MKNHRKYSTAERERKVFAVVMIAIMVILVTWFVLEACGVFAGPTAKPDRVYPMANAHISWEQSFHAGGWGNGGT